MASSIRASAPGTCERTLELIRHLIDTKMALLVAPDRVALPAWGQVGAHLFEEYLAGDEGLVKSKAPKKDKSYAALRK